MSVFVICDPYLAGEIQPTHFSLVIDGGAPFDILAFKNLDNSVILHYDISMIGNGKHTVYVKAVIIDPIWGRSESPTVPFVFTRNVAPGSPAGIALRKE